MNIFLDIETIPGQPEDKIKAELADTIEPPKTMSKVETIQAWHKGTGKYAGAKDSTIEKAYRDTSFNGAIGQICSIAVGIDDMDVDVFCSNKDEANIIHRALSYIEKALERPEHHTTPFFIGHFIGGFDLKFLYQRCVILNIKPPFALPFSGRHGKDFYCTQSAWCGSFGGGKISQDSLCKALRIEGKPKDIDGSKIWDHVKDGDIKRVGEYNIDDVEKNRQIYNRLNFTE